MRTPVIATATAAAVLSVLLLAGCSNAPSGSDTSGTTTITFAHWGNNSENATIKAMVADFEKANPDIDVQNTWIQNDYEQKLQVQIAGGSAPTVAQISNTSLAGFKDAFQPVDVDPGDYYTENIPNSMKIGGKYYAVPFVAKTKVTALNTKAFADAGVETPSTSDPVTPEEYLATAAKLTTGSGSSKRYGSAPLWSQGWMNINGATFFNDSGTKCTMGSDAAVTAIDQVIAAQTDDGVSPTPQDVQGQDMFDWLSIGRIAMQPDFGPWNIAQLVSLSNASDFAIVPNPGKGEPIEIDGFAVSKTAKDAQATAGKKFADFMSTNTTAQERLTTKESSLGIPVVQSAVSSFERTAPSLNLKAFVDAVSQSTIPTSIKDYNKLSGDFNNGVNDQTALGTGKGSPATVLPKLQKSCQAALTSGS